MNIEVYKEKHNEALMTLWWDSWHSSSDFDHPRPLKEWECRFDVLLSTNLAYVTLDGAELLGFVMFDVDANELSLIFVHVKHQQKGIGRQLFTFAMDRLSDGFTLKVIESADGPRRFYESFGMIAGDRILNPFNGKYEVLYRLKNKNLSD